MVEKEQTWKDFKRVGKMPTYLNPRGKTEEELWVEWKRKNYKRLDECFFVFSEPQD